MLKLDLLRYQPLLELKQVDSTKKIYCFIRKKWLVVTPEEVTRQLMLHYLTKDLQVSPSRIAVERQIKVLGLQKRFDILIFDNNGQPNAIVELKAPNVPIDQGVFDQIGQYNISLQAPYLLVSNLIESFLAKIDFDTEEIHMLEEIPPL